MTAPAAAPWTVSPLARQWASVAGAPQLPGAQHGVR